MLTFLFKYFSYEKLKCSTPNNHLYKISNAIITKIEKNESKFIK